MGLVEEWQATHLVSNILAFIELNLAVTLLKFVETKLGLLLHAPKKTAKARKAIPLINKVFITDNDTVPK